MYVLVQTQCELCHVNRGDVEMEKSLRSRLLFAAELLDGSVVDVCLRALEDCSKYPRARLGPGLLVG